MIIKHIADTGDVVLALNTSTFEWRAMVIDNVISGTDCFGEETIIYQGHTSHEFYATPDYHGLEVLRGSLLGCGNVVRAVNPQELASMIASDYERRTQAIKRERMDRTDSLRSCIARFDQQETKPETRQDAAEIMRRYNEINNESGYGVIKHIISREERDQAAQMLTKLLEDEEA